MTDIIRATEARSLAKKAGKIKPRSILHYNIEDMFRTIKREAKKGQFSAFWDYLRFDGMGAQALEIRGFKWEVSKDPLTPGARILISWEKK